MQFQWKFDSKNQALQAPSGLTITVREVAKWVQDRVHNRHDLSGAWSGWRFRGDVLMGPGGIRVKPETLRRACRDQEQALPTEAPSIKSS